MSSYICTQVVATSTYNPGNPQNRTSIIKVSPNKNRDTSFDEPGGCDSGN
jgi:hypothetical protein